MSIPDTTPLPPPLILNLSNLGQYAWPTPPAAIQLIPLFGSTPTEHMRTLYSLYASQLATIIWCHGVGEHPRQSVVVGLALIRSENEEVAEYEKTVFQGVMVMLHEILTRI